MDLWNGIDGNAVIQTLTDWLGTEDDDSMPDAVKVEILTGRCNAYIKSGNYTAALRDVQVAHELQPDDPAILSMLAQALGTTGQIEEAWATWESLFAMGSTKAIDPEWPEMAASMCLIICESLMLGTSPDYIKILLWATRGLSVKSVNSNFTIARLYTVRCNARFRSGGPAEKSLAFEDAKKGYTLDPKSATAAYQYGRCLEDMNRFEEAETVLLQCLATTATASDPRTRYEASATLGNLYHKKKDYRAANKYFTDALEFPYAPSGDIAMMFAARGTGYYFGADFQRALHDADLAIRADPSLSDAYYIKARAHEGMNHYHEALIAFRKAIELAPNDEVKRVYMNTASILVAKMGSACPNYFDEQRQSISTVPKKEKTPVPIADKAQTYKDQGNQAFAAQEFKRARDLYTKAIDSDPHSTDAAPLYSNRSAAHSALGDFTKALKDATFCVRLRPDWSKAHYRKGRALEGLKRFNDALCAYREVLRLDPDNSEASQRISEMSAHASNASKIRDRKEEDDRPPIDTDDKGTQRPVVRPMVELVTPASVTASCDITRTPLNGLLECIEQVSKRSGDPKPKRSAVGEAFKKMFPKAKFGNVVAEAVGEGKVMTGGSDGSAWITLTCAQSNPTQDNAAPRATEPLSDLVVLQAVASNDASSANSADILLPSLPIPSKKVETVPGMSQTAAPTAKPTAVLSTAPAQASRADAPQPAAQAAPAPAAKPAAAPSAAPAHAQPAAQAAAAWTAKPATVLSTAPAQASRADAPQPAAQAAPGDAPHAVKLSAPSEVSEAEVKQGASPVGPVKWSLPAPRSRALPWDPLSSASCFGGDFGGLFGTDSISGDSSADHSPFAIVWSFEQTHASRTPAATLEEDSERIFQDIERLLQDDGAEMASQPCTVADSVCATSEPNSDVSTALQSSSDGTSSVNAERGLPTATDLQSFSCSPTKSSITQSRCVTAVAPEQRASHTTVSEAHIARGSQRTSEGQHRHYVMLLSPMQWKKVVLTHQCWLTRGRQLQLVQAFEAAGAKQDAFVVVFVVSFGKSRQRAVVGYARLHRSGLGHLSADKHCSVAELVAGAVDPVGFTSSAATLRLGDMQDGTFVAAELGVRMCRVIDSLAIREVPVASRAPDATIAAEVNSASAVLSETCPVLRTTATTELSDTHRGVQGSATVGAATASQAVVQAMPQADDSAAVSEEVQQLNVLVAHQAVQIATLNGVVESLVSLVNTLSTETKSIRQDSVECAKLFHDRLAASLHQSTSSATSDISALKEQLFGLEAALMAQRTANLRLEQQTTARCAVAEETSELHAKTLAAGVQASQRHLDDLREELRQQSECSQKCYAHLIQRMDDFSSALEKTSSHSSDVETCNNKETNKPPARHSKDSNPPTRPDVVVHNAAPSRPQQVEAQQHTVPLVTSVHKKNARLSRAAPCEASTDFLSNACGFAAAPSVAGPELLPTESAPSLSLGSTGSVLARCVAVVREAQLVARAGMEHWIRNAMVLSGVLAACALVVRAVKTR